MFISISGHLCNVIKAVVSRIALMEYLKYEMTHVLYFENYMMEKKSLNYICQTVIDPKLLVKLSLFTPNKKILEYLK